MTVGRLKQELTLREYFDWLTYYGERQADAAPKEATPEELIKLFNAEAN